MNANNSVHTVLFDLDGTLRHNRPDATQSFFAKASELGVRLSPENRRKAMRWNFSYWADSEDLKRDQENFGEDLAGFWLHFTVIQLEALGVAADRARQLAPEIYTFMDEEFAPEDIVPEEVPETLAFLQKAGYKMAVVSNRDVPFEDYIEELGLDGYFDFCLAAGEVNSWKPDPEIFDHALQRADSAPEHAVYIGDNYYADVIGARRAGIRPILLDPDDIFSDADCDVIPSLDKVIGLLNGRV